MLGDMKRCSSHWSHVAREGYAAACNRLDKLETVVAFNLTLTGGHLPVIVSSVSQWDLSPYLNWLLLCLRQRDGEQSLFSVVSISVPNLSLAVW